jgi:hypothetical protein
MLHYRRWSKREEHLSLPKRWSLNFGAWILTRSGWEFLCVWMDASEEEVKEVKKEKGSRFLWIRVSRRV